MRHHGVKAGGWEPLGDWVGDGCDSGHWGGT